MGINVMPYNSPAMAVRKALANPFPLERLGYHGTEQCAKRRADRVKHIVPQRFSMVMPLLFSRLGTHEAKP